MQSLSWDFYCLYCHNRNALSTYVCMFVLTYVRTYVCDFAYCIIILRMFCTYTMYVHASIQYVLDIHVCCMYIRIVYVC